MSAPRGDALEAELSDRLTRNRPFLASVCRACFDTPLYEMLTVDKIKEWTGIELRPHETASTGFCAHCSFELRVVRDFRLRVAAAAALLESYSGVTIEHVKIEVESGRSSSDDDDVERLDVKREPRDVDERLDIKQEPRDVDERFDVKKEPDDGVDERFDVDKETDERFDVKMEPDDDVDELVVEPELPTTRKKGEHALVDYLMTFKYNRPGPHECPKCRRSFTHMGFLRRHLLTHVHAPPRRYLCSVCGERFKRRSNLQAHAQKHSLGAEAQDRDKRRFACDRCDLRFALAVHLANHKNSAHVEPGRPHYSCDSCGRTFAQKKSLAAHVTTHAQPKPFACEKCGKRFALRRQLKRHGRTHSETHLAYLERRRRLRAIKRGAAAEAVG